MNIAVGVLTDIIHCGFYALVAPKSHFPQGQMLAIATGFIVLLVIYEMITYAIKPKARPDA